MKPLQDLLPLVEISSHYTLYLKCVNIMFAWYVQYIQFRSNVISFPEESFLNAGTNIVEMKKVSFFFKSSGPDFN